MTHLSLGHDAAQKEIDSRCMQESLSELFNLEQQFSLVDDQVQPDKHTRWAFGVGFKLLAAALVAAIWYFVISPEGTTVDSMMAKPAAEALQNGVAPVENLHALGDRLGFDVNVPNLNGLGAEAGAVGTCTFCGQPSAVVQFQYGQSKLLYYSFGEQPSLLGSMKQEESGDTALYVASSGPISIATWHDRGQIYHALVALTSEQNIANLARQVETYL